MLQGWRQDGEDGDRDEAGEALMTFFGGMCERRGHWEEANCENGIDWMNFHFPCDLHMLMGLSFAIDGGGDGGDGGYGGGDLATFKAKFTHPLDSISVRGKMLFF